MGWLHLLHLMVRHFSCGLVVSCTVLVPTSLYVKRMLMYALGASPDTEAVGIGRWFGNQSDLPL